MLADERREILKHNYGGYFYTMLKSVSKIKAFYKNTLNIGRTRWETICQGEGRTGDFVDRVYAHTLVDKKILTGEKRIFLYADTTNDDDESKKWEIANRKNILKELEQLTRDVVKNHKKLTEEQEKKYNKEIIKFINYIYKLKWGNVNRSEVDKNVLQILNYFDKLQPARYLEISDEFYEQLEVQLEKHIELLKAVKIIKKF